MAVSGALEQTKYAFGDETTNRAAGGRSGEADSAGKPVHGNAEARLTFEEGVAQKKRVDGAIDMGEAKGGSENVFQVFPENCGVEFFAVHG